MRERYPREARLRKRRDYVRVQGRGRKIRDRLVLVAVTPGEQPNSRFGITVSRKVGGSVTRNKVKRWFREAIRRERVALEGSWDVVFIAHPRAADAGFVAVRGAVTRSMTAINAWSA